MSLKGLLSALLVVLAMFVPHAAQSNDQYALIFSTMDVEVVTRTNAIIRTRLEDQAARVSVHTISAEGDPQIGRTRFKEAIGEALPDVVVSIATMASIIAMEELRSLDVPQVFVVVGDPVGAGLVDSVGNSSGELRTGIAYGSSPRMRVSAVKRILGDKIADQSRIMILSTDYPSSTGDAENIVREAKNEGLAVEHYSIEYKKFPDAYEETLDNLIEIGRTAGQSFDYLWQVTGPVYEEVHTTGLLSEALGKPIVYGNNMIAVKNGALFSAQVDIEAQALQAAELALRVLSGEDPSSIPVDYSSHALFSVNLETAESIGVRIPLDILSLSNDRIFK